MFIDFKALKESVTIETAMVYLGLKGMTSEQGSYRGSCPTCKAGGKRALVITPEKESFYCFTMKRGGDVISLTAHINGTSMKEAANFLLDRSAKKEAKKATVPQKNEERTKDDTFQPLSHLSFDHEAVRAIGISAEDAKAIGIGFASRGLLKGYVCIPVRLENGFLSGYVGVHEGKVPKIWHFPKTNVIPITKRRA